MATHGYNEIENEMINFDFSSINEDVSAAQKSFATRENLAGSIEKLCSIWKKIRPFIKLLEKLPVVGKFVVILANVLDAICPA